MTISDIKKAVSSIVDLYPISRVVLFGSRADGTNKDNSDVDLIVEFDKPVTLIMIASLTETLKELLGFDVDVIHGPIRENDMIEVGKEIEIYAA